MPVWSIHHDADIYPEPEKYIPERFTKENKVERHPYAYLPFGLGPRNCIGKLNLHIFKYIPLLILRGKVA